MKEPIARALIMGVLTVAVVSCGVFDDGPREVYLLNRVAGAHLPVVLRSITTASGSTVDFVVVAGELRLYDGDRMEIQNELQEIWDGSDIRSTSRMRSAGQYQQTTSAITVRFRDQEGIDRVFVYQVLTDGGLRGLEWEAEAEYRRR